MARAFRPTLRLYLNRLFPSPLRRIIETKLTSISSLRITLAEQPTQRRRVADGTEYKIRPASFLGIHIAKYGKKTSRIALRPAETCLARVPTICSRRAIFPPISRSPLASSSIAPSLFLSLAELAFIRLNRRARRKLFRRNSSGRVFALRRIVTPSERDIPALDHRRIHRPAAATFAVNTRLHRNDAFVLAAICPLPIGRRHRI